MSTRGLQPQTGWTTVKLGEFAARLGSVVNRNAAIRAAVESAAESVEAEVALLLIDGAVAGSIGFAHGVVPDRLASSLAKKIPATLPVPGVGELAVASAPLKTAGLAMQLVVARCGSDAFTQEESDLLRGMVGVLALTLRMLRSLDQERALRELTEREIAERRRAEARLEHVALHDPLTGLPNRILLQDRLAQALARGRRAGEAVAVIFLDLDGFKLINDSLGHALGDRLLIGLAGRLSRVLRSSDTVSRIGTASVARLAGDEFVMLCEGLRADSDALAVAERLREAIHPPFSINGHELYVTASVGVAVTNCLDITADEMVRDADIAMYSAKSQGRDRCQVFDSAMRSQSEQRLQISNELRSVLKNDELRLHYQPILALDGQRLVGFEALLRWHHPERGLVPPNVFIPVAESSGLIVDIGAWVMDEACAQLARWREQLGELDLRMSVNVSALQLMSGLVDSVRDAIARHDIDPGRLLLEITETAFMERLSRIIDVLSDLKDLGVRIALDDFGTGYSSLAALAHLPIDVLKLDRGFIRRLGTASASLDRSLVEAALDMARSLEMTAVAEGVEEPAQRDWLLARGCPLAQGYLFSKPVPPEEAIDLIRAHLADAERLAGAA